MGTLGLQVCFVCRAEPFAGIPTQIDPLLDCRVVRRIFELQTVDRAKRGVVDCDLNIFVCFDILFLQRGLQGFCNMGALLCHELVEQLFEHFGFQFTLVLGVSKTTSASVGTPCEA